MIPILKFEDQECNAFPRAAEQAFLTMAAQIKNRCEALLLLLDERVHDCSCENGLAAHGCRKEAECCQSRFQFPFQSLIDSEKNSVNFSKKSRLTENVRKIFKNRRKNHHRIVKYCVCFFACSGLKFCIFRRQMESKYTRARNFLRSKNIEK